MQFAGMAFQMGILLAIGAFLGKKLDHYFALERPYLTILCLLLFFFAALYLTLKDIIGNKQV